MSKKKTRRNRRIRNLLLVTSLLMVVAMASVGVTVAWLTDTTGEITNTFTSSNIDIEWSRTEPDSLKLVPGNTIAEDAKVTVKAGSEACYLFVKVETSENFGTYLTYEMDDTPSGSTAKDAANVWTALDAEKYPGVFYRNVDAADKDQTFAVLKENKLTVRSDITKSLMDDLDAENATQPTLSITAYACQQANVADAATAWGYVSPADSDSDAAETPDTTTTEGNG